MALISTSQYLRLDGQSLAVNGDDNNNRLIIDYPFPITLTKIRFNPLTINLRDQFSLFLRSSLLDSATLRIDSGQTELDLTLSTQQVLQIGWYILLERETGSTIAGRITTVSVSGRGRNRYVTVRIIRSTDEPLDPMFETNALTQIRYAVPLITNLVMVNEEPIIYDIQSCPIDIALNQDLLLTYSTNKTNSYFLFFCLYFKSYGI